MNILVIGGAGYIGSHVCKDLINKNHNVIVFDNLSKGFKSNILDNETFIKGDIRNLNDLDDLFTNYKIDAVFHFAALKAAGESMVKPEIYAENNITGTLNVLNKMVEYKVKYFIFSSSAAIFGEPEYLPVDENHPKKPTNYYGYTKLCIEHNLEWYSKLKNIVFASLRYFNACGYDIEGKLKTPEREVTNLIPVAMETLVNKREELTVFGSDYNTPDGTCIRDYIHVTDLSDAHIKALDYIINKNQNLKINLGQNKGVSVMEVIKAVELYTGKKLNYKIGDRRFGDPAKVYTSYNLAKKMIDWQPRYSDINTIIKSTYNIYKK